MTCKHGAQWYNCQKCNITNTINNNQPEHTLILLLNAGGATVITYLLMITTANIPQTQYYSALTFNAIIPLMLLFTHITNKKTTNQTHEHATTHEQH